MSPCQHCGAPRLPDVRFCGQCGKASDPVATPAAAPKGAVSKKTMMGFQQPVAGAPPVAAPAAVPVAPQAVAHFQPKAAPAAPTAPGPTAKSRTMLGIQAASIPGPPAAAPAPVTPRFAPQPSAADPNAAAHAKTMLGVEAVAAPQAPPRGSTPTPAFTPVGGSAAFAQTALGAPAAQAIPAAPPASAPVGKAAAGRTMLGMSAAQVPAAQAPAPAAAPRGAAPATHGRTMLGVTPGVAPVPTPGAFEPTPIDTNVPSFGQTGVSYQEEDPYTDTAPPSKSRTSAPLMVGLLVILLSAGAGAYFMFGREHVSKVQARVVATEDGDEAMQFEVAGAVPGAKIRFGGQERALEAGRVVFPLAKDSLRVGDNVVLVDLLEPEGEVTSERITLAVDFRIRSDTAALSTDPAAIDVVVSAVVGSTVTLDGEALALDATGKGVKRYPIDVATQSNAGAIDHLVKYRVQPPSGEASVGELVTKIPLATLQIDRPGLTVVTDRGAVEIAGAVAAGAKLTVDGSAVAVNGGRFLHQFMLPDVAEYSPRVVASEQGKAPYGISLSIRRVADLAKEAESFAVDASLTYARISQNTSIYKGQAAAFEGRVYNVSVQGGRSVIQMLARDCPEGARCSLWVTYPAATDATVNSWIRVLGTLDGEQQFRSESNEVKTVPKLEAMFILPAAP